jgi:hypothetical protein
VVEPVFKIKRGESRVIRLAFFREDLDTGVKAPFDLTGNVVIWTLKESYTASGILLQRLSANGPTEIEYDADEVHHAYVKLPSAVTAPLPLGDFVWEAWAEVPSTGEKGSSAEGRMIVGPSLHG